MFTLKNLKIQIENPEKKIIKLNTDFNVVKNNFDNNNNIKFQIRKVSQQNKKNNYNNNVCNYNNVFNKKIKNKSFSLHNFTTRNNNNKNYTCLYSRNETKNLIIKDKIVNQKFYIPKCFKKNKNLTRNLTRINTIEKKDKLKYKTKNNSTIFITNIQQNNKNKTNKTINISKYYNIKESEKIILKYGEKFYNFFKKNSKLKYNSTFLSKQSISENIHLKMIDWMIEVLSAFQCSDETFFLSVHLMNSYINKENNNLKDENIHLIGIISMFISSKFEDKFPINLD